MTDDDWGLPEWIHWAEHSNSVCGFQVTYDLPANSYTVVLGCDPCGMTTEPVRMTGDPGESFLAVFRKAGEEVQRYISEAEWRRDDGSDERRAHLQSGGREDQEGPF